MVKKLKNTQTLLKRSIGRKVAYISAKNNPDGQNNQNYLGEYISH
jgi:hypothetical protein